MVDNIPSGIVPDGTRTVGERPQKPFAWNGMAHPRCSIAKRGMGLISCAVT
jgi:hypothetical protein